MKKNIVLPLGIIALLFLAFRKPKLKGNIIIEPYNLTDGSETVLVKSGANIKDLNGLLLDSLEGMQRFEVINTLQDGSKTIKFWLTLSNYKIGIVKKQDII